MQLAVYGTLTQTNIRKLNFKHIKSTFAQISELLWQEFDMEKLETRRQQ